MERRGYNVDKRWYDLEYRGLSCQPDKMEDTSLWLAECELDFDHVFRPVYAEHNDAYLQECIVNLKGKGIDLTECFSFETGGDT